MPKQFTDPAFFVQPGFSLEQFGESFKALQEYFGILQMYTPACESLVERFNGLSLPAHMQSGLPKQAVEEQASPALYRVTPEKVAVFRIDGPTMKYVSSMREGTSTVRLRQQMRLARNDAEVAGAILIADTPGGTVRGNADMAREVAEFAAVKPIYGFTEDMTASAGVSVLSQTTKRFANNATAVYGAMGTYNVLVDQSARVEQLGFKVHVIKAGEFKGMGQPGTKLSEEQLAEAQRIVDAMNEGYLELIAQGTGLSLEAVRTLADGRAIMGAEAVKAGLIHGVQSFEQTYAQLVAVLGTNRTNKPPVNRSQTMAEKNPASLADLKAKFPKANADFLLAQIEAGADMTDAAVAYATHVETQATKDKEAHQQELEKLKNAPGGKGGKSGTLGHQPIVVRSAADGEGEPIESGDPVEDFNAVVAKLAGKNAGYVKRMDAVALAIKRYPDLYQAYLLATNPGGRAKRLITEKLEIEKAIADRQD